MATMKKVKNWIVSLLPQVFTAQGLGRTPMEIGMHTASNLILKEIHNGCKHNVIVFPLQLHEMLNDVGSSFMRPSTLDQLLSFLESDNISHVKSQSSKNTSRIRGPIINFVNGMWVDSGFNIKPSFKQFVEHVYKTKAESADFSTKAEQATNELNLFAEKATKGFIKQLHPRGFLRRDTNLVFSKAFNFEGNWLHTFDDSRTRNEQFHLLDGKIVKAPFMRSYSSDPQFYGSFEGFKLLKMPFSKSKDMKQYSMFIFLPDKIDGLKELVQKFNYESSFLHEHWDLQPVQLSKLWIPKSNLFYEFKASDRKKELGLNSIFKMNNSNAICKAYMVVNEQGIFKAGVTTKAVFATSATPREPPSECFVADRPFMFTVKEEKSGIVLVTGAVLNPLLSGTNF